MEGKPMYFKDEISIAPFVMLYFSEPTHGNEHEPLINNFTYFKTEFDMFEGIAMNPTKLRVLLLDPDCYQHRLENMLMVDDMGELFSVHLPLLEDLIGFSQGFNAFIKNVIEGLSTNELIPSYLGHLIDPKPVLDLTMPVYGLGNLSSRVLFASYTDAFQACQIFSTFQVLEVKVMHNILHGYIENGVEIRKARRFHDVLIDPKHPTNFVVTPNPLKKGTMIICWNARGVARASFQDNFEALLFKHKASVFVITETMISDSNMLWVMSNLGDRWSYINSSEFSAKGGVAIIYDRLNIIVYDHLHPDDALEASVLIQGKV